MTDGFYTAKCGVSAMQTGLDITANNIANVSTDGYKTLRGSFADLMYTVRNKANEDVEMGHGVKIDKTDLMFGISSLRNTGGEIDYALPNEGFFAVKRSDGTTAYTRNGAFSFGITPDGTYQLCDCQGNKVLDGEGNPIQVGQKPTGAEDIEAINDKLCAYTFDNPYGLELTGDNFFLQTASSGEAKPNPNLDILNGFLENSGTNIAEEMVNVIQYQRAFSLNTKMVQTADEIEKIVNNLR